jgi:hypothetical protein
MALDEKQGYDQVKSKIKSYQAYKDISNQYNSATRRTGDSIEDSKEMTSTQLSQLKEQANAYQRELKSQFEELLDVSKLTGGKGVNTYKYLKKTFIKIFNKIKPQIDSILVDEIASTLGCDQQQTYEANGQKLYIKVKSVDLRGTLKLDPQSKPGRPFYEKLPLQVQTKPFSMNRELFERIQSNNSYFQDYGQYYLGVSGQPLFDIKYVDVNPTTGVGGGWFEITLQSRANNLNKVIQFLKDYYKTITITDFITLMASIMDSISGAVSINADFGIEQTKDATTFSLFIQRILGLCFDNEKEIDVSGISKLSELDNIDESFFELTDIDLRNIDNKVSNIQNGVIQFEDCDNVILPVDSDSILDDLNDMFLIESITELENAGDGLTNTLTSNPKWGGFQFDASIQASVDFNFIKLFCDGVIRALLTPKIILPLMIMLKSITTSTTSFVTDTIQTYKDFCIKFKKLIINLISKIGALFVRELFEIIKKDLFALLQSIIKDLAKEKVDVTVIIILKLVQLLIVVTQFVKDWRRCKSVVDELLKLLTIATSGFNIPSPLLAISSLLDGFSSTRAFIGSIEEMQKLGIPTGSMPDGSPNLDVLSKFGQMKAQERESAENGKVVAVSMPGKVFPNGTTGGSRVYGKSV